MNRNRCELTPAICAVAFRFPDLVYSPPLRGVRNSA